MVDRGKHWTFRELREAVENYALGSGDVIFPQGQHGEFLIRLLAAWRSGRVTCPLEVGQMPPSFENVPPGCAHLKLTSASTGAAKCVVFTAAQLEADALNIVSTMRLRPEWPNLGVISLAHSYGFSNLVLPLLLHGIPLIIAPAPLPEAVLQSAKLFPCITLPAVPALWRTWSETRSIPSNVKLAISAGAPLPLELEKAIYERDRLKIHNFYGSSECGGIAYDVSEAPREDASLAGVALDTVQLSVSESGTLVVKSPAVGETYWPENREELSEGTFITSDLAEIREGRVYLRGRTSDLINVAGRKVAPEQIELALRGHPAVTECVVFSVPDQDRFELIVAAVNSTQPLSATELSTYLSSRILPWQIPRDWWFCPELTVNQRGKISRREWRGKYLQRVLKPAL